MLLTLNSSRNLNHIFNLNHSENFNYAEAVSGNYKTF